MAPTVFSLIFAICFVLLTSLLPIRTAGEIKDAVTTRFLTTPWQLYPTSTVENVRNGVELYQWLTEVFVSQLYAGYPINGDADGYCTEQYPCLLDEGDADTAGGCARGLVLGEDNCPSWMVKMDCCEPCIGEQCADFYWHFDTGVVAESTSVPDVSANCAEAMPSWLNLVDTVANLRDAPVDVNPPNANGSFPFCPERTGRTGQLEFTSGGDRRPVTVGEYNRAVMGRLTLKRFKFTALDSDRFVNAYPTRIETSLMSAYSNSDAEEKGPFGSSETYTYSKDGGFRDTGGYIIYFDFARSEDVARNALFGLYRDYWFDMSLGSFVWEVLFYNANANLFIHVSFIFEQRFTGLLKFHIEAAPLDLTLHEVSDWETWLRYILFTIIILLLIFFAKNEVDDMSTVRSKYFLNTFNLVHLATLGLTVYLLILYFRIVLDYRYVQFEFPMVNNVGGEEETFRDLVNLANEQMNYNTVISITTCLIFSRCISLLASLAPSSGAIFNTFYQAKYNILSAFFMLAFFFMGFTFCSWVLLSTRGDHFNDLPSTITSHITMVMGFSNYEAIVKGDNAIALPYFCVFHLVWLVIKQLLLSIIICGYFREKMLMRRESNKYPLRRFLHTSVATLREWLSPLLKGIVTISNLLFGSSSRGGTVRVNYEQVGKLKDRRTTKPRMRSVEYERKGGDSAELSIKPSKDIELEARFPYFRDGHMHYYVKSLGEGPAKENAVLPNERLVSITKHDRKDVHFRDRERFETTYGGDASKILPDDVKDLPVVLEFEGYVKPVTLECIGLLVFVVVYSLFVTNVARTEEVQNMRMLTERHLWDECWYEYNPERVVCFDDIMDMSDVVPWMEKVVLEMEYGCATTIDHPDCSAFDQAAIVRDGWIFWAGAYGSRRFPRTDYPPLGITPQALAGYSAGYVAWRDAWADDPAARQPVEVLPRAGLSNIGVMPQNHMRMTIQITCFKENTFKRTEKGIPFVLFPEVTGRRCADDDCQKSVIKTGETCRNLEGTHINPSNIIGAWSKIPWSYSEMSSYGEHGGIAIGLGSTRAEAAEVLVGVSKDRLLAAGTASVVIDWVSYNGELDLFTYKQVLFSVADSGKMFRELRTTSFALNLFSAGPGEEGYRYFNVALCITYMVCAVMFTFYLIQDLFYVQYQITTQLQRPWYMFVPNFFQEDWWNFVDVVSVCLNISVIYRLLTFMLYQGSFNSSWHVLSWVITDFQFRPQVNDRDQDEFSDFYEAAKVYENFLELAAINGMFLLIRCMKYFGAVPPLRLIMQTLSAGLSELLNLSFTLLVLLFSFVLLFFVQYGVEVQRVSTFHGAFVEMFLYLVGSFNVWDLFENDPIYFTILLLIYTVLFGFLLTNIFLAVIVWQWQEVRKDAQNKSITDLIIENMGDLFECFAPFVVRRKEQEKGLKMLDKAFWQKLSAIQYLEYLDERGALRVDNDGPVHTKAGSTKNGDGDAGGHHPVEDDSNRIDLSAPGGRERFDETFRRAHMEIASTMCRAVPDHALDIGAGVASVLSEDEDDFDDARRAEGGDAALAKNELQSNIEVPMLDLPVEENRAIQIEQRLRSLLSEKEQHQHCDEIWLDCLITVLEDVGALGKLQDLFRPPPMHKPKKEDDKAKFENEKLKMQKRLDRFLSMCKEETRKQHYIYLKERAAAKDRVLKQQSIYLAEYLAELNQGIVELNGKIDTLGKENARMRTHVTPLL